MHFVLLLLSDVCLLVVTYVLESSSPPRKQATKTVKASSGGTKFGSLDRWLVVGEKTFVPRHGEVQVDYQHGHGEESKVEEEFDELMAGALMCTTTSSSINSTPQDDEQEDVQSPDWKRAKR